MKKCLIIFTIAILSIIPISNVNALDNPDLDISYLYSNNTTHIEYYNKLKKIIITVPNGNIYEYSISKSYFLFYWQSQYFVLLQSDSPISFEYYPTTYNSYNKAVSDSDIYTSIVNWDRGYSTVYTYENVLYELGTYKSSGEDMLLSSEYINNWSQIKTNSDIYKTKYSSTTLYVENNLIFENNEYISYEWSIKESEDGNLSYYDIRVFTDNYNEDYEYLIKFDDEPFRNISSYVTDDGIIFQIPYNTTMYLWVRDNMLETIEAKTFTFMDLIDLEEYDKPSIDINVGCSTNINTDLEQAYINFKFNNYSTMYKYQYSFNDLDYIDINYSDIKNKSYGFYTHINTPVFVRILDNNDSIVYKNSSIVDCIIESEKYYYYEFTLDDLYDKENNRLIFYTLYYENIRNRDIVPFIYFYYSGSDNLPFHITYNSNVIDFSYYITNLKEMISDDVSCTNFPYEFIDKNLNMQSYTSYTAFSFMPCIDLTTFSYGEQYTDFKLIVKSNIKLDIGEPIYFNGAFIPSINNPIDSSNTFQSNFTVFFSEFRNAFNRFKDVIIEIFQNCTYFFDNSNVILKDFYIVVFTLILFLFLIKFIL